MNQTQIQSNKQLQSPKIIKKYGNRKLYDTEQSSYVVLKDIEKMIRNKEEIRVIDNETQDDITIPTLTQIIFSSEKKSKVSPPINILKSIIREADGSFSAFLAKMGFFEAKKEEINSLNRSLTPGLSSEKKANLSSAQSLEQKIENLMNADDDLSASNTEDIIPELPGNRLS